MNKLLAIDLDGTLCYPRKIKTAIPRKNINFLRRWIDAGNRVVIISSRSYQFTKKLELEIERKIDFINCTGAQITAGNETIRDVTIPRKTIQQVLKEIDIAYKPIGYLMTTKNYPLVIRNNHRAPSFLIGLYTFYHFFQFKMREPYVLENDVFDNELLNGDAYKIMIFFGLGKNKNKLSKEINKELRDNYPEVESSWTSVVNEITPKKCSKAEGLKIYTEKMNINPEDVYVVGDSGNDITMFNMFYEHSYCMMHAYPTVKKYAKHTISRVYKLDKLVLKGELHE